MSTRRPSSSEPVPEVAAHDDTVSLREMVREDADRVVEKMVAAVGKPKHFGPGSLRACSILAAIVFTIGASGFAMMAAFPDQFFFSVSEMSQSPAP